MEAKYAHTVLERHITTLPLLSPVLNLNFFQAIFTFITPNIFKHVQYTRAFATAVIFCKVIKIAMPDRGSLTALEDCLSKKLIYNSFDSEFRGRKRKKEK